MAKLGWKLAMLCTSLLLGGCGDDEDTGDTRLIDHAEYGVEGVSYEADVPDTAPLPPAQAESPER
jgi:hypothetical protein